MCKHHKIEAPVYTHFDNKKSLKVLRNDKNYHCSSCCPDTPTPVEKVEPWADLEGVYPVYNESSRVFIEKVISLLYFKDHHFGYETYLYLKRMFQELTMKEVDENKFSNQVMEELAVKIEQDRESIEARRRMFGTEINLSHFKLMKRSPKISNVLASILKHVGEDHEKHELVRLYNNRGTSRMDNFEMVLSTEPHRIAGMSAYGKYTSCQDWIRKEPGHEYHHYTHQSWANLNDPTVGVLFIRDTDSKQGEDEGDRDMYARSLVRVLPLNNGQVVLYLHRIYSMSPYENYLMASVDRWEATLPENYHVIKLYDDDKSRFFIGTNKYGVKYDTSTYVKHHLEDCLTVYGEQRDECHCCEGSGQVYNDCQYCDGSGWNWEEVEVQCPDCDGDGEFYDEDDEDEENHCSCENCDGTGVIMNKERVDCDECAGNGSIEGECTNCDGVGYFNNEEECYPYNDHTGQITFEDYYIKFKVPNHIMNWNVNPNMNWDVNPNQAEEDNNDEQIA